MTLERLNQLNDLRRELKTLQKHSKKKTLSDCVMGSKVSYPYTLQSILVAGTDEHMVQYDRTLANREERIIKEIQEIEVWIDTVDDPRIRAIVQLRFIEERTWRQIPRLMGLDGNGSTEQKALQRYLKDSAYSAKCDIQ